MPFEELVASLPAGTVSFDEDDRAAHARDWWPDAILRERAGVAPVLPAAVVRPSSAEQVSLALAWADRTGRAVVPYGGGSGVCGGAQAVAGAIALDTRMLDGISIDEQTLTVEAGAGVMGPDLEAALAAHQLTLGHFPQSIDISTVGGWCATRSAGQKSGAYGRIDDMVLGLEVVLAGGRIVRFPARAGSSAGPDLLRLFLGSEGTLGVITRATLKVRPAPSASRFAAYRFAAFADGLDAMRVVAQGSATPAVARLYDEADAGIAFRERAPGGSVLIVRYEGDDIEREERALGDAVDGADGGRLDASLAESWWEHRNDAVATFGKIMREKALGPTAVVDTMEISGAWPAHALYDTVRAALQPHADVVACHASHIYPHGVCLYFTFVLLNSPDDAAAQQRYDAAWRAGMRSALDAGATITHHHGIGLVRAPWMAEQMGEGMHVLRAVKAALDPNGIMNPGKAGL